jgi:hypothetical protein
LDVTRKCSAGVPKASVMNTMKWTKCQPKAGTMNDRFTSEPSVMMLSNEVITMIFSYFNVCELSTSVAVVCKQWHLIVHSPVL